MKVMDTVCLDHKITLNLREIIACYRLMNCFTTYLTICNQPKVEANHKNIRYTIFNQ